MDCCGCSEWRGWWWVWRTRRRGGAGSTGTAPCRERGWILPSISHGVAVGDSVACHGDITSFLIRRKCCERGDSSLWHAPPRCRKDRRVLIWILVQSASHLEQQPLPVAVAIMHLLSKLWWIVCDLQGICSWRWCYQRSFHYFCLRYLLALEIYRRKALIFFATMDDPNITRCDGKAKHLDSTWDCQYDL